MAIFKRKNDKQKNSNEENNEVKETSIDELAKYQEEEQKIRKKIKRSNRLKKFVTYTLVTIGILGGLKGLTTSPSNVLVGGYATDTTMLNEYITAYFTYPATEETAMFLSEYSLVANDLISYQEVQTASVKAVNVYQAERVDESTTRHYIAVQLATTARSEEKEVVNEIHISIDLFNQNQQYKVVGSIAFTTADFTAFADTKVLEKYQLSTASQGEQVSDKEFTNIEQSVHLFYKTYNTDYAQSLLLVNDVKLSPLNEGTRIEVANIQSIQMSGEAYIVIANTEVITNDFMKQMKNVEIKIDKTTNKIVEMKEVK